MKIVCIADTHAQHRDLEMPEGDMLIHAGDITYAFKSGDTYADYEKFNNWLGELPYKHKIVIAGNHDVLAEKRPNLVRAALTNCIYLERELVEIEGLKIYGTPWTPRFFDWAFNQTQLQQKEHAEAIPKCDVLVTHGPPKGILDFVPRGGYVGCRYLLDNIYDRIQPKLHVFGHIHCGAGMKQMCYNGTNTTFINAAMVNEQYEIVHNPWIMEVE